MDFSLDRVAVLGTGITGTAVITYLNSVGHEPVAPDQADVMVVSPGIPPSAFPECPLIMSEIEFAYQLMQRAGRPPKLIAVTGTNGKSTVTAMIAHILSIPVAGNIGVPLIQWVGHDHPAIVIELSSYQLETVIEFRPDIAVVTNVTPDHLERHKTMENYIAAKSAVCRNQCASDVVVYLDQDPGVNAVVVSAESRRIPLTLTSELTQRIAVYFEDAQRQGVGLGVIGAHNHLNAAMAIAVAHEMGVSEAESMDRLRSYAPLPHRMEWVDTIQGRQFFDDSKATNPDSTLVAISAFSQPIHLLLGGKDKGLELDAFVVALSQSVRTVTVYGEIADRLMSVFQSIGLSIPVTQVETLDQATLHAYEISNEGDVILLSPACSSFDQFQDFNHRGDYFKDYVRTQIARTTT